MHVRVDQVYQCQRQAGKRHSTAGAVVRPRSRRLVVMKCDASRSRIACIWVKKAERRNSVVATCSWFSFLDIYSSGLFLYLVPSYQFEQSASLHTELGVQRPMTSTKVLHPSKGSNPPLKTEGSTTACKEYYSSPGNESAKCKSGKKVALQRKWPSKCPTLDLETETNIGPLRYGQATFRHP